MGERDGEREGHGVNARTATRGTESDRSGAVRVASVFLRLSTAVRRAALRSVLVVCGLWASRRAELDVHARKVGSALVFRKADTACPDRVVRIHHCVVCQISQPCNHKHHQTQTRESLHNSFP